VKHVLLRNSSTFFCAVALALATVSCGPKDSGEPVTLTLSGHLYWQNPTWHKALDEFTRETGVQVKIIAYSDEAEDVRRAQYKEWIRRRAAVPDIYQTDVSFLSTIADGMVDLNPYAAGDTRGHLPSVVKHCTVRGRLVALPLYTDVQLLYYRTDLLHKYGFSAPPKTWAELEKMAWTIQQGQRAAGQKDFWGYVWEGNPANEGLTASAFEWQASEGGGHIIEPPGCVVVNNPPMVSALKRARQWINRISPPGTTAYGPGDVVNVWAGGRVAFMRNWPEFLRRNVQDGTFEVAKMPAGAAGSVGTLGGWSLSVSKFSNHPAEAVRLVRFLTGRAAQLTHAMEWGVTPSRPDVLESPELLAQYPQFAHVEEALSATATARPSAIAGPAYPGISAAYASAVLSVLTGASKPEAAMAKLQNELVGLTGFPVCQALRGENGSAGNGR
jgi:trehalose/maltose transport system substrate-binding protein